MPSSYLRSKDKYLIINFNIRDVYPNSPIVNSALEKALVLGNTVLVKIRYSNNSYLMAGSQFGFIYKQATKIYG